MREFFSKHGESFKPQDAIEVIAHKVQKIKELVYQEDELHLEELRLLSEMLDDYVREVKGSGYKFNKKDYQDVRSHYNPFETQNSYSPFNTPNNYYYPLYNEGRQGQPSQGNPGQGQPGQQSQGEQQSNPNSNPVSGHPGYHYTQYPIYPFGRK